MDHNMDNSFLQSRYKFHKGHRKSNFDDELNNLFNKKFRFRNNNQWSLPGIGDWFSHAPWKIQDLDTLKSKLNFHKSQLNDFNIEEWSSHTRRRNPAGEVGWKTRSLVNPEFLTQAWTKFYECAYSYNVVPDQAVVEGKMVSLHLCEAPGAFITSLNHYLKCHHPDIEWQWVASTLNPYYEGNSPSNMISDDRFMFHTLPNWDFGLDNTGNLMDWENSQAIIKRARALGKVLLVTADGSIDCLQKPDAQEEVTSPLHYCEIVTALQALSEGGTLIFKLFTIFEHSTVNLLYLINNLFEFVDVYKPVTSRQGNSEVYAICLQFKGSEYLEPYIPTLKSSYGTELYKNASLFPLSAIPEEFIKQIKECAYYFCSIQCQVINNNLQAYLMQKNITLHTDMKKIRMLVATAFLRLYDLKPLHFDQEILKGILHQDDQKVNTNPRYHRGSYSERQLYSVMSLKEKAKNWNAFLHTDVVSNPLIFLNERVTWKTMFDDDFKLELEFTYGKPLTKVNSSKFIFVPIFKLYQQILAEEEFKHIILGGHRAAQSEDLGYLDCNTDEWKTISFPEMDTETYATHEKRCFNILLDVLQELSDGESVILRNFNSLTHFNVSVLFILCKKCFEKTGFTASDGIILCNLMNKSAIKYLSVVEEELRKRSGEAQDVLSALPVQITNSEQFFNNVVFYNNTFYRNKCVSYLCDIEQKI